jgi:membrane associated rhomboid family serine protease
LVARLSPEGLVVFAAAPPGTRPLGHVGGVVVARSYFADPEGPLQVVAAIRERLARVHGAGFVARLDDNERRQLTFLRRRPVVVWTLTAACVVVFVLELVTEQSTSASVLVRAGANASDLVARGEIWRLVTANLLHGSWLHLGMNLTALVSTGAVVERWLGRAGIIIVLVGSGVAGQLSSAAVSWVLGAPRISVGLSGAVFGVLGVLLLSTWRFRRAPTGGLRVPASMWFFLLATNGVISLIPIVDVAAHVGGFLGGVFAAALVAPRPAKAPVLAPAWQVLAGSILVVIVIAAALAALWSAWPVR